MTIPSIPQFVYKISPTSPPSSLPFSLPLSSLDAGDGFIHLSVATQIPITAGLFFGEDTELWLLRIDKETIEKEGGRFIWAENAPGCVHLYGKETGSWDGARLGKDTIAAVQKCVRVNGQMWSTAMEKLFTNSWLADA